MPKRSTQQFMVVFIALVVIVMAGILFYRYRTRGPQSKPSPVQNLSYVDLPVMGNPDAPNKILAVEDLKCYGCMIYNNTLFPQLKKQYIDTGKVSYHVLLVSFLPGSEPAANAAQCLHAQKPDYFFEFLRTVYANQPPESQNWATPAKLMQFAKMAAPQANLDQLSQCMLINQYGEMQKKHVAYAAKIMNNELVTPTLFVNGRKLQKLTIEGIQSQLKD